jgi:hypothetical protein
LRHRDDVCSSVVQVAESLTHLCALLTHPENEVGLGDQTRSPGLGEHPEGSLVGERGPNPLEDPRDRLDVVRENLRPRRKHLTEQVGITGEIGCEYLDACARILGVDLPNRFGVQPRALIREVIAGDASDRCVAQVHRCDRFGDASWLIRVVVGGFARVDLAKVAAPRALGPADKESGFPVFPALENVRATGLLAHRVKSLALHELLKMGVLGTHLCLRLDPLGLSLNRGLGVADFEPEQFAALWWVCHRATS